VADSHEFLTLRITNSAHTKNAEEEQRLLAILARRYGDEPATALMLVNYYAARKQLDKAFAKIAIVEDRVGSDGVINMLKAGSYIEAGAYDKGIAYARKSVEIEPDLRIGWLTLGMGYVRSKDYPRAVATQSEIHTATVRRRTRVRGARKVGCIQQVAIHVRCKRLGARILSAISRC
jgi:predicted Zn-dependent protease